METIPKVAVEFYLKKMMIKPTSSILTGISYKHLTLADDGEEDR